MSIAIISSYLIVSMLNNALRSVSHLSFRNCVRQVLVQSKLELERIDHSTGSQRRGMSLKRTLYIQYDLSIILAVLEIIVEHIFIFIS
jgi:hypothetical protein